jgi:hypothetical protein
LVLALEIHAAGVYLDCEGAKFSPNKGFSSALALTAICTLMATFLDTHRILPWYSRVPSASNLADYISRRSQSPPPERRDEKFLKGKPLKPSEAVWNFVGRRKRHMKHGWGPWRKRAV